MTPQDHNRILGIIYSFLGGVLTVAGFVILINSFGREREAVAPQFNGSFPKGLLPLEIGLIALVFAVLLLSTSYGLFRRRNWGRILALIVACLFIWLFPLGTLLAVYTWWFMHSEGGNHLYAIKQG